jgi:hypothetical protein
MLGAAREILAMSLALPGSTILFHRMQRHRNSKSCNFAEAAGLPAKSLNCLLTDSVHVNCSLTLFGSGA